ncbi:hypothetical protein CRG98_049910 [Punica granatum]|uniref:Secreted protein n=1 Tax=Punica granatum TaxID=22663 RepID=A0A2I0H1L4_PUNGR|nr:hypothetical protein CRG98_049910 [Punica granatum]
MWAGDLAICSTILYSLALMIMKASASSSVTFLGGVGGIPGLGDLVVRVWFSNGNIYDERGRRCANPCESNCSFCGDVFDYEGGGAALFAFVLP